MVYKRDKQLAKKYREMKCVICLAPGEGDHILNFKRIPSRDQEWNMWCLCSGHHRIKTDYPTGLTGFAFDHGIQGVLIKKGFYYIESSNKWWHENA